jgi:hypothetical protein
VIGLQTTAKNLPKYDRGVDSKAHVRKSRVGNKQGFEPQIDMLARQLCP